MVMRRRRRTRKVPTIYVRKPFQVSVGIGEVFQGLVGFILPAYVVSRRYWLKGILMDSADVEINSMYRYLMAGHYYELHGGDITYDSSSTTLQSIINDHIGGRVTEWAELGGDQDDDADDTNDIPLSLGGARPLTKWSRKPFFERARDLALPTGGFQTNTSRIRHIDEFTTDGRVRGVRQIRNPGVVSLGFGYNEMGHTAYGDDQDMLTGGTSIESLRGKISDVFISSSGHPILGGDSLDTEIQKWAAYGNVADVTTTSHNDTSNMIVRGRTVECRVLTPRAAKIVTAGF